VNAQTLCAAVVSESRSAADGPGDEGTPTACSARRQRKRALPVSAGGRRIEVNPPMPVLRRIRRRSAATAVVVEPFSLLFGGLSGHAVPFLQAAGELFGIPLEYFHVVVGELAPFLFHLAFDLFPVAGNRVGIHGSSPAYCGNSSETICRGTTRSGRSFHFDASNMHAACRRSHDLDRRRPIALISEENAARFSSARAAANLAREARLVRE
jgi:hypothetical protein